MHLLSRLQPYSSLLDNVSWDSSRVTGFRAHAVTVTEWKLYSSSSTTHQRDILSLSNA